MVLLSERVFAAPREPEIEAIMRHPEERVVLLKQVAQELKSTPQSRQVILPYHARDQIDALTLQAEFSEPQEALQVGRIVYSFMRNNQDVFPQILKHHNLVLAEHCLIALGFFREYLEHKARDHNGNPPEFFEELGRDNFRREGYLAISNNFSNWTDFMHEQIAPQKTATGILTRPTYRTSQFHKEYGELIPVSEFVRPLKEGYVPFQPEKPDADSDINFN